MATFDQLSADKRAIVELVLQQGKSYDELSGMLGMSEDRVRSLARDALVELAPHSATRVEEDWRGQLADYVLGQQSGPEATATRGHLRRSEAARIWANSLLDSLDQLYENGSMPAIPEGERRRRSLRPPPPAAEPSVAQAGGPQPRLEALAPVRRRRIVAGAAAAVLVLVIVLLWPIGVLTRDDGADDGSQASTESPIPTQVRGEAVIGRQGGATSLLVRAVGLEPSTRRSGYQVWLYNGPRDRKSLGWVGADQQGNLLAGSQLPRDYRRYRFIDVTPVSRQANNSVRTGESVLRGLLQVSQNPVTQGTGRDRITVIANIRLVPLPN
jgi:hypothetical protein